MPERRYRLEILGRGEEMRYFDEGVELSLDRTWCEGNRLFCDGTLRDKDGNRLPFEHRRRVIENLCDFFGTTEEAAMFVIHEEDPDARDLAGLFDTLVSRGHRITVEPDSAALQQQRRDEMYLGILKAGKELTIDGAAIPDVDAYWAWKQRR